MPEDSKVRGFPDISSKLSAPTKKSLFERQKAEAEAKRARERAETAAVYEDFVKSFDDDGDTSTRSTTAGRLGAQGHGSSAPGSFGGGPSRRHFTGSGARSSGRVTSSISISRKRTYEGLQPPHRERD